MRGESSIDANVTVGAPVASTQIHQHPSSRVFILVGAASSQMWIQYTSIDTALTVHRLRLFSIVFLAWRVLQILVFV